MGVCIINKYTPPCVVSLSAECGWMYVEGGRYLEVRCNRTGGNQEIESLSYSVNGGAITTGEGEQQSQVVSTRARVTGCMVSPLQFRGLHSGSRHPCSTVSTTLSESPSLGAEAQFSLFPTSPSAVQVCVCAVVTRHHHFSLCPPLCSVLPSCGEPGHQ